MGRSIFGYTADRGYHGHENAAAYHDHKRRADREDAYEQRLERAEAARKAQEREAAE